MGTHKTIVYQTPISYRLSQQNLFRQWGKTPACNQHNVFMDRIKDELDGEGDKTFVTPMDKSKGGGRPIDVN